MGQKTNPQALRIGITQQYLSDWYTAKTEYPTIIKQDLEIRKTIYNNFKSISPIAAIHIKKNLAGKNSQATFNIIITALYPRIKSIAKLITRYSFFEQSRSRLSFLIKKKVASQKEVKIKYKNLTTFFICFFQSKIRSIARTISKFLKSKAKISFSLIQNPLKKAALTAHQIGEQLEKRLPFKRILKQTLRKMEIAGLAGAKIELSGRLNGIEIARSEWNKFGKIPLHSLESNIDYVSYHVKTIYGVIGIKVWIYNN